MPTLQGVIGQPYSSRRLSIEQCYEMRADPIIQFAEMIAMSSIFMANWHIECKNARLANFVDNALRRVIGRLIIQFFGARSFGFQALVKEFAMIQPSWEYINRDAPGGPAVERIFPPGTDALIWDAFVPLRPENVEPNWAADGTFNGIKLRNVGSGFSLQGVTIINPPGPANQKTNAVVDLDHSLWIVNERDWQYGSPWGRPRLAYAFKAWWAGELTLGVMNKSIERKGDPTIVVSYPTGQSTDADGKERDNQEIALEIADNARSGAILVVPSEVWGDDDKGTGQPKWKITYLKAEENFEQLQSILGYFDVAKFRSMLVSELSVAEGSGGTSSRNVAAVTGQRTAEAQFMAQLEYDEVINRYMIPQIVKANFWEPEILNEPIRKVTKSFGEGQVALFQSLLESYANSNAADLPVDWSGMLEIFDVPTLDLASVAAKQKQLAQQAESTAPAPTPAPPANGNAGVSDTGFYYDAPNRIELEDDALLASLPQTKHYEDTTILAHTRALRKLWFDLLTDQYESFAQHLESSDVALAEDPEKKVADRIVSGWRYTSKAYQAAIKRTVTLLTSVFSRAGLLELKRANLSTDDWNPDETELAQWITNNAASMVRKIDETTRKGLNTFLLGAVKADKNAPQIAGDLRAHFAQFPSWRADLIAREEVRQFYNAATLFAAKAAKVKQVQALDARLGPERSDPVCIARNGRLFSIDDAFREEASATHPRDTLAWRILASKVPLSIERVPTADAGDWAARVDREAGVVYFVEGIDPAQEGRFLDQVGQWLESALPPEAA